jgi:HAD superfamily hydrolase (TIGR01662 family)
MNRHDLKVVLFDLGGTLMYEKEPWPPIFARAEQALQQALNSQGLRLDPETYGTAPSFLNFYNDRREGRSDGAEEISADLMLELLGKNGRRDVSEAAIQTALRAMYEVTQTNWIPEADALPTLQKLKEDQYRIGLISNAADDENTQRLIDKGGFRPYLDFIVSSAACGIRKPDPRIYQLALDHFKVPPAQAVMIGDSLEADVAGGRQAGLHTIWIARRAQSSRDASAGISPSLRVNSLSEIPEVLSRL